MSSISERREAALQQKENLIAEHQNLQAKINEIRNEATAQISNMEKQQQNIVITVSKIEGKIEVYNEEEPAPPADVIPLKSDEEAEEPDDAS
tara:strand:- start:269 stop:544 length:276 start_codon:yes stop_codon:yes gene_type:complete